MAELPRHGDHNGCTLSITLVGGGRAGISELFAINDIGLRTHVDGWLAMVRLTPITRVVGLKTPLPEIENTPSRHINRVKSESAERPTAWKIATKLNAETYASVAERKVPVTLSQPTISDLSRDYPRVVAKHTSINGTPSLAI